LAPSSDAHDCRWCFLWNCLTNARCTDLFYYFRAYSNTPYAFRIGKADAVLRELYRSMVTKRELLNTAKLSVFKSVFVPALTCGGESWVMTARVISEVQMAYIVFLLRVHGMTLYDEVRSGENRKSSG